MLYLSPIKALGADVQRNLQIPLQGVSAERERRGDPAVNLSVAIRTGDTTAAERARLVRRPPDILITTPESLFLMLTSQARETLRDVHTVIIDEIHAVAGSKRGTHLALSLERLESLLAVPAQRIGLSATVRPVEEVARFLGGDRPVSVIHPPSQRALDVRIVVPVEDMADLPPHPGASDSAASSGRLGSIWPHVEASILDQVLARRSTIVFANSRGVAEKLTARLNELHAERLAQRPTPGPAAEHYGSFNGGTAARSAGAEALIARSHHGSVSKEQRREIEQALKSGALRCVVATSSLDLGVDFPSVDQVLQIGSPKGIARLLQRAGRAKHRPGESGHIVCVPSHALELVEYAAARRALAHGHIEARRPLHLSLDVLAQHAVSCALGGGFDPDVLFEQVRRTHAFAGLDRAHWEGVLEFIVQGGRALSQYPDFHKVVRDDDGMYRVHDRRVALRHRLSIGTITSDGSVMVQFLRGGRLGAVEEQFLSRLRPGDRFQFAGRLLELVRLENLTAYVRKARGGDGVVPRWQGGRLPLSEALGHEMEAVLASPPDTPEMRWLAPLLALQTRLSALPGPALLLVEHVRRREGQFVFVYPFAGRQVNEGLAALMALRWTRLQTNTFGYAANDYGFVLAPARPVELDAARMRSLLSPDGLLTDLRESLNLGELARRQFRDIARVSGMLVPALPGRTPRSLRQLQASSGLLYDVLRQHDPDHILLTLAEHEVLHDQLDLESLARALSSCQARTLSVQQPTSLGPLSFPLWAERLRGQLSNEDWKTRVLRAAQQLEKRHGA